MANTAATLIFPRSAIYKPQIAAIKMMRMIKSDTRLATLPITKTTGALIRCPGNFGCQIFSREVQTKAKANSSAV